MNSIVRLKFVSAMILASREIYTRAYRLKVLKTKHPERTIWRDLLFFAKESGVKP